MTTYRKRLKDKNGDTIIPALSGDETKWIKNSDIGDEVVKSDNIDWATIERIPKEQFFQSVTSPYNIGDCFIYKFGPFINIQRLVVNNSSTLGIGVSVDFGVVDAKYAPRLGNKYMKLPVDKAGISQSNNGVMTANLNGTVFSITNTSNTSYSSGFYLHNITYLAG